MPAGSQWYKDAVIYQLHIRAFFDDNDDGIGDFRGLTRKLDYLQDLGVTAIWLLPFYPSPLRDDGYDIADYYGIHPKYGTLHDFRTFLREAHERGLRVITELVLNHTSDEHPWFRRARIAKPGSRWRDFYVWSDTPDRYKEARIIFKDFETSNWAWDPVAQAYFWHRFYRFQPDLNFDNPEVRKAMLEVMDYWFGMGVDGMRLDAVPYLVERDGTSCENLPETHAILKELRAHIDAHFEGRMLLAEANQWPEDAVNYFGNGDECHTAFHFPLMPRLFMAVQMEDRFPIVETLADTPPIPDVCQWMVFLRNHDELTLEMVTDEERDFMYRAYARDPQARINLGIRRRLAPLMQNNRRTIELLNGLLLSLPGTPVIYYGDELGMGDNIYLGDRNGVRTPMQWNYNRNAGFSNVGPQQLFLPVIIDYEYHYETVNVETQQKNPSSLLRWMQRLIGLRQQSRALGRGSFELLQPNNPKVFAFLRRIDDEQVLVVANLSRFPQYVELDLASFAGSTLVEMFGQGEFPQIKESPYLLTLAAHGFYWFGIHSSAAHRADRSAQPTSEALQESQIPLVEIHGDWDDVFEAAGRRRLEKLFPGFLASRRWFGGKARTIRAAHISDVIPMRPAKIAYVVVQVIYNEGEAEVYLMPVGFASEEHVRSSESAGAASIMARIEVKKGGARTSGVLYDAFGDEDLSKMMLEMISSKRRFHGEVGQLAGRPTKAFRRLRSQTPEPLKVTAVKAEQSNSTLVYGEKFLLKQFRRLEEGVNPELEIGEFLTDTVAYSHSPPLTGAIEYLAPQRPVVTVAVLEGFVHNQGTAWNYTLEAVEDYFEGILVQQPLTELPPELLPRAPLLTLAAGDPPPRADAMFGSYLESAALLGRRTAEMHIALATPTDQPQFGQEPFTPFYQRSLYQTMRNTAVRTFALLKRKVAALPEIARPRAEAVLSREAEINRRLKQIAERKITAMRIRCHGDFHLGQILHTGNDFVIIDYEGEPTRSINERQIKASPFRDLAGMIRSFDYACYSALADQIASMSRGHDELQRLRGWMQFWTAWTSEAFLKAYMAVANGQSFIPASLEESQVLLDVYMLEKALYELRYELNNRPDWARIPLYGIIELLDEPRTS
ncbi:MAG TPA: maltose alpha-D-glucosyltransferase [Pirellulales bacterium]|nr:maltose alpha-D-glucosyltransferase [Pirellulales bacterium]